VSLPIVIVPSGGIPITEATNGQGTPVSVASNGFGTAVTVVASGGMPVVGSGGGTPTLTPFSAIQYWLNAGTITGVADGSNIAASNWVDGSQSNLGALATATNAIYRATGANGKPTVEFNGSTSVCVSPAMSVATPRRVFMVMNYLGAVASGAQDSKYIFDGGALDQGSLLFAASNAAAGGYAAIDGDTLSSGAALWAGLENRNYLVDVVVNGASSTIQVDSQNTKTGNFTHAATYTAMTLGAPGNQLSGYFGNLQIAELILCDGTLTAAQATQIRNYLNAKYSLLTRNFLICDGNSITSGTGSTNGTNGWPVQIAPLLTGGSSKWFIQNNGVGGQTTPQMDTLASPGGGAGTTDVRLGFYTKTIVTGWEITNDIVTNNVSAATGYSNIVTFFNHRRSANAAAKLVVMTCLPRTTITGANETTRQTINSNITTNWASFADAVLDVANLTHLTDPTNATYYADGTHLTDAGYAVVAAALAPIVNGF
jgi:lysophospholipase L1-like esterase